MNECMIQEHDIHHKIQTLTVGEKKKKTVEGLNKSSKWYANLPPLPLIKSGDQKTMSLSTMRCSPWGSDFIVLGQNIWHSTLIRGNKRKQPNKVLKKKNLLETLPLEHSNSMSMSSTIHYPPILPTHTKKLLQGHWKPYISFFALVARKLSQIQSLDITNVSLLAPCRMILAFPLHNFWTFSALANVDIGHCLFCRILQVLFESGGWER